MIKKLVLISAFVTAFQITTQAQKFEWLRHYGSTAADMAACAKVDSSGNIYIFGHSSSQTLNLGGILLTNPIAQTPPYYMVNAFLMKMNQDGQVLAARFLLNYGLLMGASLGMVRFTLDDSSNIYLWGQFRADSAVFGQDTLKATNGRWFLAKYNKNLDQLWVKQYGNNIIVIANEMSTPRISVVNGSLLVIGGASGNFSFGSNTYSLHPSLPTPFFASISPANGAVLWSQVPSVTTSNTSITLGAVTQLNNKLYFTMTSAGLNVIQQDSFWGNTPAILMYSTTGTYLGCRKLKSRTNTLGFYSLTADKNYLYASGSFSDTTTWGADTLYPDKRPNGVTFETFFCSMKANLDFRWVYDPIELNPNFKINSSFITSTFSSHGNSYFAGRYWDSLNFSGTKIVPPPSATNADALVLKIDSFGDLMWVTTAQSSAADPYGFDGLADSGAVFCGGAHDTLHLGPYTVANQNWDAYVVKITDYSIVRGNVYAGPYCAGDSIVIPYTKRGDFDTSNYFVAELSDPFGNFNGHSERELGRIKSTGPGTIYGTLPFQYVASSQKYRIRVRSTSPVVYSYFKRDTLRLLVYSRDTADAGPDRAICKGDSVELLTYGGTKWKWTPGATVTDSTFWLTKAFPSVTTTYRITISDSSGCGQADTDYVTVFVRPPLDISSPFSDTSICEGQKIKLTPQLAGGDSSRYTVRWLEKLFVYYAPFDTGRSYTTGCTGACQTNSYANGLGKTVIAVLWDSCSAQRDTQFYFLRVRPQLKVKVATANNKPFTDTLLCSGQQLQLFASGTGGDSLRHQFRWYDSSGTLLQTGNNLLLAPVQSKKYYVVLGDSCMPKNDTLRFTVRMRPPLQVLMKTDSGVLSPQTDTLLCISQPLKLYANSSGGDTAAHTWSWYWNDTLVSHTQTIQLPLAGKTTQEGIVKLQLNDNCSSPPDAALLHIRLRKPLLVQLTKPDTICYGASAMLQANIAGGDSNYTMAWYQLPAWQLLQKNATTPVNVAPGTGTTYALISTDACNTPADTQLATVHVRSQLLVTLLSNDTTQCSGNQAQMKAQAVGGRSNTWVYKWYRLPDTTNVVGNGPQYTHALNATSSFTCHITDGCSAPDAWSDTLTLKTYPPIQVNLSGSPGAICKGDSATLNAAATGGHQPTYNFIWNPAGSNDSVQMVKPGATTTYTVQLSDICQAKDTSSFTLTVQDQPKAGMAISPGAGCAPLQVQFSDTVNKPGSYTYNWFTGEGHTLKGSTPTQNFTYPSPGTYIPRFTIRYMPLGCSSTITGAPVFVYTSPVAALRASPDTTFRSSPPITFINLSTGGSRFCWNTGSIDTCTSNTNPLAYHFTQEGKHLVRLVAQNSEGCSDTAFAEIIVLPDFTWIPNAFTPNENSLNETFHPYGTDISKYHMLIYSRWGELVFETRGPFEEWNGCMFNQGDKPLQEGAYAYKIEVYHNNGSTITHTGFVTLLR